MQRGVWKMRTILSAVVAMAILAPGSLATGQDAGSEAVDRAEVLQTEAIAAYKQKKYPDAVNKLREADGLLKKAFPGQPRAQRAGILYDLGDLYLATERPAEAIQPYSES